MLFKKGRLCEKCGEQIKKRKNNYFIYLPIKQQIQHTLDKHLDAILHLADQERKDGELHDVFDSNVFKNVSKNYDSEILLPLTLNLDGAKIFNSSKTTLWPIQVVQNYLPANIRFRPENILIVGLFCGPKKPDIPIIMAPFAQEMKILKQNGIFVHHKSKLHHFIPTVMFCSCDLPCRAEVQNCKPMGYFGCPYCLQEGESVKNVKTGKSFVRFLKTQQAEIRTHQHAISVGFNVLNGKPSIDAKGIKGLSCMIAFKDFDLAKGFPIDYMHGVCIGVVPLMLDIWLGKKKLVYEENELYRFKQLSVQQRLGLNRRILALKPGMQISHKPRSILDRNFYTANEFRSLLWYYLRFALYGILKKELINHFTLLSDAIYILSKNRLTKIEVVKADAMLNKFVDEFETFYGRNSITINIHMLRHYSNAVMNTGPLFAIQCFHSNRI